MDGRDIAATLAELWQQYSQMKDEHETAEKAVLAKIHELEDQHIDAEKAAGNLLEIGTMVKVDMYMREFTAKIDDYHYGSNGIEYEVFMESIMSPNYNRQLVHPSKVRVIESEARDGR
jgi:hypothetical protein